jgi:hypothetical protein
MFRHDLLTSDGGRKLFRQHPLGYRKESLDDHAHMVEISLLYTTPDAWAIAYNDRERIEQDYRN